MKVAILDTGVDRSDRIIQNAIRNGLINENDCRGFPASLKPLEDAYGHGTHCASVILRTAPLITLYVARIADDFGNIPADNSYSMLVEVFRFVSKKISLLCQALEWAISFGVDIISLSWGLDVAVDAISKILRKAHEDHKILIFASASNSGRNTPITFPATLDFVFCIGATDGLGNRSPFTPPDSERRLEKYCVLGEGVSGDPNPNAGIKDTQKSGLRMDGTSTATPIAAGIAALTLDLILQASSSEPILYEGRKTIRKIFLEMSRGSHSKSYFYLKPWSLFSDSNSRMKRKRDLRQQLNRAAREPPGYCRLLCFSLTRSTHQLARGSHRASKGLRLVVSGKSLRSS